VKILEQQQGNPTQLRQMDQQQQQSVITDWADAEGVKLSGISTTLDGIAAGVLALDKMITDFQNSPGTLSAADQAALDAIQSASNDLAAKASAISTKPPGA
jgi:hypothetical protein